MASSDRSAIVSRSGSAGGGSNTPRSAAGAARGNLFCCNRCRKPLSTTVFYCSCNCIFCEQCTYDHFNNSSRCPICGKNLGATDFTEIVVANPSAASEEGMKQTLQAMFTKLNANASYLSHSDVCTRLCKAFDNQVKASRFVMRQIVLQSNTQAQRAGNAARAYETLKREYNAFKQQSNSNIIKMERTTTDLERRVLALNSTVQEQQKKLAEKDNQIAQFRQICASEGQARVPSTSHSTSSGGKRGGSGGAHGYHASQNMQNSSSTPPMQGFVREKQARERAKEQALNQLSSRVPLAPFTSSGGHGQNQRIGPSDADSIVTPIQVPPSHGHGNIHPVRPYTNGSAGSGGSGGIPQSSSGIRDITANSGYVFTSRNHSNGDYENGGKRQRLSPVQQPYAYSRTGRPSNQQQPYGVRPSTQQQQYGIRPSTQQQQFGGRPSTQQQQYNFHRR